MTGVGRVGAVVVAALLLVAAGCSDEMFDAECDLIVLNDSVCAVTVLVDGREAFTVESGSDRTLDDIGPGQHVIEALDSEGTLLERRTVELASGEDFYLILDDC
ncbi:MAG: hypothetical protein HXY19_04890 [Thermoanaerobaculaceae bacterium]|nr:hypothetical protein [Thermoanaerobaculaceae bacterium]